MTIYITELITGLLVIAGLLLGRGSHEKTTFEIHDLQHQQTLFAVQQIASNPTKPIVANHSERNLVDQNRKLWACLGDVSSG